jgi:photosystem II stability/assembly factor-like uncharacterized protein
VAQFSSRKVVFRIAGLFALAALILAPDKATAGLGFWSTGGPGGATVSCLAVDPKVYGGFFACAGAGVYVSSDFGLHWQPTSLGVIAEFGASSLVADSSGAMLAGTTSGVFRSTDSGLTWLPRSTGLAHLNVYSLALQPDTGWLYLGATNDLIYPTGALYRSVNDGASWEQIMAFPSFYVPSQVLFDARSSSVIYTGAALLDRFNPATANVATSLDGGTTWTVHYLPVDSFYHGPAPLVVDPKESGTIYAAAAGNFLRSSDFGVTWTPVGDTSGSLGIRSMAFNGDTLYAASSTGVLRSDDRGATWTSLLAADTAALAFGSDGSTIVAGANQGTATTRDGGKTWTDSLSDLAGTQVHGLVLDPTSATRLWASAVLHTTGYFPYPGLFQSRDGGTTWTELLFSSPSPGPAPTVLAADAFSPGKLYGLMDSCHGVATSEDGGYSWLPTPLPPGCWSVAVDPATSNVAYAAGGGPLKRTVDGGLTWTEPNPNFSSATDLAVDPRGNGRLYAWSSFAGPFRSDDGGATWKTINAITPFLSLPFVHQIAIDSLKPDTLYAAAGSQRLFRSSNGGDSWQFAGAGLALSFCAVAAVDSSGGRVFAGGDGGVFVSSDEGKTWQPFNHGLSTSAIRQLVMDPHGRFLHAGTDGGGVFDYEFSPTRPEPQRVTHSRHTIAISRE